MIDADTYFSLEYGPEEDMMAHSIVAGTLDIRYVELHEQKADSIVLGVGEGI
jgi:hypothetical protein